MSLIDEALKRARLDAARHDAARQAAEQRGLPAPWAPAFIPERPRTGKRTLVVAVGAAALVLALGAVGIVFFLRGGRSGAAAAAAGAAHRTDRPQGRAGQGQAESPAKPRPERPERPEITAGDAGRRGAAGSGAPEEPAGAGPAGGRTGGGPVAPGGTERWLAQLRSRPGSPGADRGPASMTTLWSASSAAVLAPRLPAGPVRSTGPAPATRPSPSAGGRAGGAGSAGNPAPPAVPGAVPAVPRPDLQGTGGAAASAAATGQPPALEDGKTYRGEVLLPGGGRIKLAGIAYSAAQPVAVINGRVVGPGQAVDEDFTVVKIEPQRVELRGRGVTFYLQLR
ncbi:MAG TPA: hypothetical protein VHR45_06895 [Thermoanaerobaculia bacterium]|nr:hypothetical protein [Thermoanaerobaculia bacterium]